MNPKGKHSTADVVAGSGLLHRRALLGRSLAFAGAVGTGAGFSTGAAAEALTEPDWSLVPGDAMPPYQVPSPFEKSVVRLIDNPRSDPVISHARTPHHLLNGIITPNGLHFNVNHGGVPAIDPSQHKLLIHGLVKRPLVFTVEARSRDPHGGLEAECVLDENRLGGAVEVLADAVWAEANESAGDFSSPSSGP